MKINLRSPRVLIACLLAFTFIALAVFVLFIYDTLPKLPPEQIAEYREAAEQGNYVTGHKLASMYEHGRRGVKQDYKDAYYLYGLSYVQVQESEALEFQELMTKVKKNLTHQEIAEVDRRILEWIKKHPKLVSRQPALTPESKGSKGSE